MKISMAKLSYIINSVALILIITSNFCFYTVDNINIYAYMTIIGCITSLLLNIKHFRLNISKNSYFLWLTSIYTIFLIYGLFYLRAGKFSRDGFVIRYIENFSIYLSLYSIIRENNSSIVIPFLISGFASIIFLLSQEWSDIINGGIRIGDSLSGNVNTVGFNFGFISLLISRNYMNSKKKSNLFLLAIFIFFMILTGSKKTLFIVVLDLFLIFFSQNNSRLIRYFKILLSFTIIIVLIFNVPYFYNILGSRIISMIDTFLGKDSVYSNTYSYSTDMREFMIKESFKFFLKNPIFGGGFNNFLANTITQYEYSHSNYTEMLCSFGLIGTIIFYSKYFSNFKYLLSNSILRDLKYRNYGILVLVMIVEMLAIDWMTVTFSGQSVSYLPIIASSAIIGNIRNDRIKGNKYERKKIST